MRPDSHRDVEVDTCANCKYSIYGDRGYLLCFHLELDWITFDHGGASFKGKRFDMMCNEDLDRIARPRYVGDLQVCDEWTEDEVVDVRAPIVLNEGNETL